MRTLSILAAGLLSIWGSYQCLGAESIVTFTLTLFVSSTLLASEFGLLKPASGTRKPRTRVVSACVVPLQGLPKAPHC